MGNHGRWKIKPKLTRVISLSENGKSTVPTGPTGPNMAWHGQIPVVKSPFLGEISFIPSVKRPPRMDHWDFVPSPVSSTESVSFFNFSACGDKPHIGKGECYATRISSTVVHRHGTSCKVLAPSKKPLRISLTVVQHNKKAGWTVEPPPWIHRKNSLDKLKRVWQPKWWFNQRNLLLQTAKQPGIYRNQATKWSRVWLSMANIIDKIRDSELLQKKIWWQYFPYLQSSIGIPVGTRTLRVICPWENEDDPDPDDPGRIREILELFLIEKPIWLNMATVSVSTSSSISATLFCISWRSEQPNHMSPSQEGFKWNINRFHEQDLHLFLDVYLPIVSHCYFFRFFF